MRRYRKFKKKFRMFHLAIISMAIFLFWWATWGLLDHFMPEDKPYVIYLIGMAIAFLILYIDNFHLKELE